MHPTNHNHVKACKERSLCRMPGTALFPTGLRARKQSLASAKQTLRQPLRHYFHRKASLTGASTTVSDGDMPSVARTGTLMVQVSNNRHRQDPCHRGVSALQRRNVGSLADPQLGYLGVVSCRSVITGSSSRLADKHGKQYMLLTTMCILSPAVSRR